MAYNQYIGTDRPALIVILLDQSDTMKMAFGEDGTTKATAAAFLANGCIQSFLLECQMVDTIKERCFVVVIGYGSPFNPKASGEKAYLIVGGKISEVASQPIRLEEYMRKVSDSVGASVEFDYCRPIWVEPIAEGDTSMAEAFAKAKDFAAQWVLEHPENFPPIVINITAGQPYDAPGAARAANELKAVATSDGQLLLFTSLITSRGDAGGRGLLGKESDLNGQFERLMFRVSSEVPPSLLQQDISGPYWDSPQATTGSRGLVINDFPRIRFCCD